MRIAAQKQEPEHLAAWQSYTRLWKIIFSGRDWFCPISSRGLFYKGHAGGTLRFTFFAAIRPDMLSNQSTRQLADDAGGKRCFRKTTRF
jgi:hypothetical protein